MGTTSLEAKRNGISVFVVAYNREAHITACLKAVQFADEIILIDKGSSDKTVEYGAPLADKVITVPWSPTVEGTRAFALAQCSHDWILYLDDDELLSWEAVVFINDELRAPRADIYCLPQKHYILGAFEADAYYWPECHPRLFRKGAIEFTARVHGGVKRCSEREYRVPTDGKIAIHHLSHADVHQWIEKTNRYTDQVDRVRMADVTQGLAQAAHLAIDKWVGYSTNAVPGSYVEAVAVLRALYDIIDGLKEFEERRGISGKDAFSAICQQLEMEYERGYAGSSPEECRRFPGKATRGSFGQRDEGSENDSAIDCIADASPDGTDSLLRQNRLLRIDNERWQKSVAKAGAELAQTKEQLDEVNSAYQSILKSKSWRYTRALRGIRGIFGGRC